MPSGRVRTINRLPDQQGEVEAYPRHLWNSEKNRELFSFVCSIRGSQITARRVTDGQFADMRANAVINTTDEPEKNERVQTPQAVPDLEITEKENPPSAPPDPPNTMATVEKPMEPLG